MCPSSDTYIRLPVEKYELVSAPGVAFTTRAIARRTAGLALRSALEEWKTTVLGDRSPAPSVFERPLARLVRRLAGNGEALVPPCRELPGRVAAEDRQCDPAGDHRPSIAGREMRETRESALSGRDAFAARRDACGLRPTMRLLSDECLGTGRCRSARVLESHSPASASAASSPARHAQIGDSSASRKPAPGSASCVHPTRSGGCAQTALSHSAAWHDAPSARRRPPARGRR